MPALREIQQTLLDALLSGELERALPLVRTAESQSPGLMVHRSTVVGNFEEALESIYPVTMRLVGPAYFHGVATAFQRLQPSASGDLADLGAFFSAYLAARHRDDGFDYLADIARLEWSIHEACRAAAAGPLDLAHLRAVAPVDYDDLRFELHPTLRLFRSDYPARLIWEENMGKEPAIIDLGRGGDRLAVMRPRLQPEFLHLSVGEFGFLEVLSAGMAFGNALERAADLDADFDGTAALNRFVCVNAIVGLRPPV